MVKFIVTFSERDPPEKEVRRASGSAVVAWPKAGWPEVDIIEIANIGPLICTAPPLAWETRNWVWVVVIAPVMLTEEKDEELHRHCVSARSHIGWLCSWVLAATVTKAGGVSFHATGSISFPCKLATSAVLIVSVCITTIWF